MNGDYIKISRKILEWEWWGNINVCRLFIYMLLKANWKDGNFQGREIKRGSFVSSYPRLESETGLTINEIRTAILKLKSTGEITVKSYSKYSVFTIKNYDSYQDINSQNNSQCNTQSTGKSQSINSLLTTIEEKKERKNNISVIACERFEEFWNAYPNKSNRLMAEQSYMQLVLSGIDESVLITSALNYSESCVIKKTQKQFIKNPSNWLNESVWVDYTQENYKKPEEKKPQAKKNSFTDYPQRKYNYAELEKQLLNSQ